MMKKGLLLSLMLIAVIASAQTTINRQLGDFTILKVYNGIDVELIKSEEQRIEISGEKAAKVKIKNDGVKLKISLKFPETIADGKAIIKLYFNRPIFVVDGNEGATITGKDLEQEKIELRVQEGAFMNLVVQAKHLKVKASSGGIIKLSGSTKNENVEVNLGGVYHGYNMETTDMSIIRASSGGKAEVASGETLDAKVTFGGSIFYKGTPEVLKNRKVIGGIIEQRS